MKCPKCQAEMEKGIVEEVISVKLDYPYTEHRWWG